VTGAGPIGLLAALLGRQRGLETHVVDVVTDGAKPRMVGELGAHYHAGPVSELPVVPDIVLECTGLGEVAIGAARRMAPGGVLALTGISQSGRAAETHPDEMNKALVLGNKAIVGSVNAARRHYEQAATALSLADPDWLARLVTRRLRPDAGPSVLQKQPGDIKVVVEMSPA